jgi:hypothetical protein
MGFLDRLLGRGKQLGSDAMRQGDRMVDRGREMMDRHDHEHDDEHEHGAGSTGAGGAMPEAGTPGAGAGGESSMPETGTGGQVTPP